ncbi:MAG: hypothetical protein HY866_17740, partial [Chloroflexi bacterium]|nr:hypothetical protein [Chloroflexota bacterium]
AAITDGDVVFVQMNSFAADEIMPFMDSINAHTVIPMHFSPNPDNHYLSSLSLEEFLAAVPADTLIVAEDDEIEIVPDMPVQIVTMTHWAE